MYEKNLERKSARRAIEFVSNIFVSLVEKTLLNVSIIGLENIFTDRPTIYDSYHNTAIDPPLLVKKIYDLTEFVPHALMDSRSFSRTKIGPAWYGIMGLVPFGVNHSCKSTIEDYRWSMQKMKKFLGDNESVLIYSDGPTKKNKNTRLEERPNSSIPTKLSFETGIPIQPVALWAPKKAVEVIHVWPGKRGWKFLIDNRKLKYVFSFLPQILPENYSDPKEMKEAVRSAQIEEHYKLTEELGE